MRQILAATIIFSFCNISIAQQIQDEVKPAGNTQNQEAANIDSKVKEAEIKLAEAKAEQAKIAQKNAAAKTKAAQEALTVAETEQTKILNSKNKENDFWDDWGIGLSVSTKLGKKGRAIDEAQLVNGIVRVTSERDVVPRLMLERHWYLQDKDFLGGMVGVFVGTSLLGEKKLLDSVSLGLIWGFKPRGQQKVRHNIGIGLAVEPYSRTLGDGLEINAPLPAGENSIRYKEKNRMAAVVFYTFTPSL